MGFGPGQSIEYTKPRVRLEGHPWPGCHPVSGSWHPFHDFTLTSTSMDLNREDCLAGSALAGVRREIGAHRVDRFRRKGKVKWSEGLAVNQQRLGRLCRPQNGKDQFD